MLTLLPHILLGLSLAVQLLPSIAAPTPLNVPRAIEGRAKNNSRISLFKDALPVDESASPFIILGAQPSIADTTGAGPPLESYTLDPDSQSRRSPPLVTSAEEIRALSSASGIGLTLGIEPLEPLGQIGTDTGSLEARPFKRRLQNTPQGPGSESSHGAQGADGDSAHNGPNSGDHRPEVGGAFGLSASPEAAP